MNPWKPLVVALQLTLCGLFLFTSGGIVAKRVPELACDPNKVYLYSYKQASNVFGGAYMHIEATLELFCGEKVHSKKLNTDLLVTSLHFVNPVSYLKPPKCAKTATSPSAKTLTFPSSDQCKKRDNEEVKELEKPKPFQGLEASFGFVQDGEGRIIRMFSRKGESTFIRDLKKAVVSQFQTKLRGSSERIDEDNTGVHKTHYSKALRGDGKITIKAEHDAIDAADAEGAKNSKGTEQHTECSLTLSEDGRIESVNAESSFEFAEEEDKSKIPFENSNSKEVDVKSYVSVSGEMTMTLKGTRAPHGKHTKLHKVLVLSKHIIEGAKEEAKKELKEQADVFQNDILELNGLHQHSTRVDSSEYSSDGEVRKTVLEEYGGFAKLLDALLKKPELLSLAIQYIEFFPKESLPVVWRKFKNLEKDVEAQTKIQALMAESQSPLGVKMLIRSMTEKPLKSKLIQAGLLYTTSVEKPTPSLAKFVESYIKFEDETISSGDKSTIRTNAFLYLANVVSKLGDKEAKPFVEQIQKRLKKDTKQQDTKKQDTELNILAAHNMGKNRPRDAADILETVLDDDTHTESVKIFAVKALRSHLQNKDASNDLNAADTLIHKILTSDRFSDEVKVAAIHTQTHRQSYNKNDASVGVLTKLLQDPNISPDVHNAIMEYLSQVVDKERVLKLMKPSQRKSKRETGQDSSDDTNTLIWGYFEQAIDSINIVKHAEEAYNAVKALFFSGDDRDYSSRSFPTSSSTSIIVRDPYFKNMFGRVSDDMKNLRTSNNYVSERREGNDAVHMYVGFAAVSGSTVPGCQSALSENSLLWAAMAGFSSYVKLLAFRIPIMEFEFRFNRLRVNEQIDDFLYVLAGDIYTRSKIIPGLSITYNGDDRSVTGFPTCNPRDIDIGPLKFIQKKLFEREHNIYASFVLLKFRFTVSVTLGLGIRMEVCLKNYRLMAGPAPYVRLSTQVAGGASLGIATLLLGFSPQADVRIPIVTGIDRCTFSTEISLEFTPFIFQIKLIIETKVKDFDFTVYEFRTPPFRGLLFKYPRLGMGVPASQTGTPLGTKPLSMYVTNPNNEIFHYEGHGTWKAMPGRLKQLSVGSTSRNLVWGVNSGDDIFYLDSDSNWQHMPGKLTQISVGCDGTVVGVTSSHEIFIFDDGSLIGGSTYISDAIPQYSWRKIDGLLKWVAVGDRDNIWGINMEDKIFKASRRKNAGFLGNLEIFSWEHIPGSLSQIAVSCGGNKVVGVNSVHNIFSYQGNHQWHQLPGLLNRVEILDNDIWGVNHQQDIFVWKHGASGWTRVSRMPGV